MINKFLIPVFLTLAIFPALNGQNKAKKFFVTGIVTDANNNPVEGAIILIDNKYTNGITDSKGYFKVRVKKGAELVSVVTPTMMGEALIEGEKMLNINLREGISSSPPQKDYNKGLDEDINVGYGSVKKKDLVSPVNKLDASSSRFAAYTNIYEVLKGAIPGVQVNGNKITIQGAGSINLSTEPLFIVDGFQVGSLDGISPTQVESIEVLKGSSASIYGSRGANGVILIKLIGADTKR